MARVIPLRFRQRRCPLKFAIATPSFRMDAVGTPPPEAGEAAGPAESEASAESEAENLGRVQQLTRSISALPSACDAHVFFRTMLARNCEELGRTR